MNVRSIKSREVGFPLAIAWSLLARLSVLIRRTTNKFRIARHPTTIRWEPPLASAPAVSKFGGIVLSQCGAACV